MAEIGFIDFGDNEKRYLKDRDLACAVGLPAGAGKNLLKNTASSTTVNGVTFTVNADKSVTVSTGSGGATADTNFDLFASTDIRGTFILSSGVVNTHAYLYLNGYNGTTYVKTIAQTRTVDNDSATIDYNGYDTVRSRIKIDSGTIITTPLVFYPMIRPAGTSPDYVPYSESVMGEIEAISAILGKPSAYRALAATASSVSVNLSRVKDGITNYTYLVFAYAYGYNTPSKYTISAIGSHDGASTFEQILASSDNDITLARSVSNNIVTITASRSENSYMNLLVWALPICFGANGRDYT